MNIEEIKKLAEAAGFELTQDDTALAVSDFCHIEGERCGSEVVALIELVESKYLARIAELEREIAELKRMSAG